GRQPLVADAVVGQVEAAQPVQRRRRQRRRPRRADLIVGQVEGVQQPQVRRRRQGRRRFVVQPVVPQLQPHHFGQRRPPRQPPHLRRRQPRQRQFFDPQEPRRQRPLADQPAGAAREPQQAALPLPA